MIGTNAVIVGKVAEIQRTGEMVRLHFQNKQPDQVFTAVLSGWGTNVFTNLDLLAGQFVSVSGQVVQANGQVEMTVRTNSQFQVLRRPAPPQLLRVRGNP